MKKRLFNLQVICIGIMVLCSCQTRNTKGPYFATGIKIGEVSQSEAIIWVRLTENIKRVGSDAPIPQVRYKDPETGELKKRKGGRRPNITPIVTFPEGYTIKNIQGACPGSKGKVQVKYKSHDEQDWTILDWQNVDPKKDYTTQIMLSDLSAGKQYELLIEAAPLKENKISATIKGKFKTAPAADIPSEVNFIVTTGTSYNDADSDKGYKIYPNSLKLNPDFFVHTGDILYYDGLAKTSDLARYHWDRMYSFENNIEFHRQVASYFIKDDHDTWMNDCYPGMKTKFMGEFTYEQGTKFFLEEVPMGKKTYRTVRWGKDLQIWLVEGRDFRSPNNMEDGPEKTIWGQPQLEWFKSTVKVSDATFKLIISPTPIVGPDRSGKSDNHCNEVFNYEGNIIRQFISQQKNMYVVCGDRHWQYISKHAETGVKEFCCGPGSDEHAGGWNQEDKLPEHIYLNVVGGFLEAEVTRKSGEPNLIFRHYTPDGGLLNEHIIEAI